MKIIIIGAGISGLSTYLSLRKQLSSLSDQQHEVRIKIYEAYDVRSYVGKPCSPTVKSGNGSDGAAQREESQDDDNVTATNTSASEAEVAAKLEVEAEAKAQKSFTPEALGNAIGISRNGLNVLARLFTSEDDNTAAGEPKAGFSEVLEDMIREGHPVTKWRMSCARGWVLSDVSMLPKSAVKDDERKTSSSASTSETVELKTRGSWHDSPINLIMISRQAFWAILLKHVVKRAGADAIQQKKVQELIVPPANSTTRTIVKFTDGTEDSADLVIGADGLRSVVRKAMFQSHPSSDTFTNAPELKKTGILSWLLSLFSSHTETKTKDYITPHYEGLVGLGNFIPSSLLSSTGVEPGTMSIVFGPNGFFGCGYITSSPPYPDPLSETNATPGPVGSFWSTFASETESPFPFPVPLPTSDRNDDDNDHEGCKRPGPRPSPYQFNKTLALSSLLSRHRSWKDPTITAILQYLKQSGPSSLDGFYPTYTTPELPTWQKNGKLVLVGDAAHALQPSSGQGACQALEDAEGLGLLLRYYLGDRQRILETNAESTSTSTAINLALESFDTLRIPRLHKIYVNSQRISGMKADMGIVAEGCMYAAIWVVSKLGLGPGGKAMEEVLGYDLVRDVERVVMRT